MDRLWNSNYLKVCLANFMSSFSFMVLAPLLPLYLSDTFGAGKHTIGIVLSGYTVVALLARLFSGYITDSSLLTPHSSLLTFATPHYPYCTYYP